MKTLWKSLIPISVFTLCFQGFLALAALNLDLNRPPSPESDKASSAPHQLTVNVSQLDTHHELREQHPAFHSPHLTPTSQGERKTLPQTETFHHGKDLNQALGSFASIREVALEHARLSGHRKDTPEFRLVYRTAYQRMYARSKRGTIAEPMQVLRLNKPAKNSSVRVKEFRERVRNRFATGTQTAKDVENHQKELDRARKNRLLEKAKSNRATGW